MSDAQGTPFNKIHNEANLWLNEICERLADPDKQRAYHALRGVLFALRDRLPQGELFQLSGQLPTMVRGIFFEGYTPAHKPEKLNRADFLERVALEMECVGGGDAQGAVNAVVGEMKMHLGDASIKHVQAVLPEDLQELFEAA